MKGLRPKQIFLIDGVGAFVTAFMLAVVLTNFESFFGMPRPVLRLLAGIACCYGFYSITRVLFFGPGWPLQMRLIAAANALYCGLTLSLLYVFREGLTVFGLAYFLGEVFIIAILVVLELRTAKFQ